ncbi:MAG: hypothetical protein DHS20C18_29030 [Saprospiraceae bacterium]|nr:MAG: hypothetical protein DHS20C18_29030 [Saprospiraceae bacterium]
MYADLFQIEGLVSSPYGKGRKKDFGDMIDLYEKDLDQLKAHSSGFPAPKSLRDICKQGAISEAPFKGYDSPSEGSDWIIRCAKKPSDQFLWVLVWGGLEDLAQALHDAPEIKEKIKVYWIGGPNKKWSVNTYAYIAENHPDLWMIEANATYRGWFMDKDSPKNITGAAYYDNYIQGRGVMGKAFKSYYEGNIKMGDTPSLVYVMNGNPDDPLTESWGGNFTSIDHSSRMIFDRNTTTADTVVAYAVIEWRFKGPEPELPFSQDSTFFTLEISNQLWPGYYLGDGIYGVRYSSKKPEICTYITSSAIPELHGQTGQFVSIVPWPGKPSPDDYKLGANWYSDRQEPEFFIGVQQGARTVSKYREEFLLDWAKRWDWLK